MLQHLFRRESFNKIGVDDIICLIQNPKITDTILINTLPIIEQQFLIKNTVSHDAEEKIINDSLHQYSPCNIIIYGKNSTDKSIETKYHQLQYLGYPVTNLYIYYGGLFEWSLLQDVYGFDNFPTTANNIDILSFKPKKFL